MNSAKRTIAFYFIMFFFIFIFTFSYTSTTIIPAHKDTIVNLSSIDFSKDILISLNDNWIQTDLNGFESCVNLSNTLTDLPVSGYKYYTNILLPASQNTYCLMLPEIPAEYFVYIDGKLVANITDKSGNGLIPHAEMINFYSNGGITNITIDILDSANILYKSNGNILLGSSTIASKYTYLNILPLLSFIVQITIGFIHFLSLYINNLKRKEYLTLSILCLSLYIRTLTVNPSLFTLFFPNASSQLFLSFDGISAILPLIILVFHLDNMFPKCLNKKIAVPLMIMLITYVIISFSIPTNRKYIIVLPFTILTALTALVLLNTSIKAVITREYKAILNFVCMLLNIITTIIDGFTFALLHVSSQLFIYSFSISIILFTNIIIRDQTKTYNHEISLNKVYSSAISHIKTEETNFLSSHLRPHFLFNALNIISGYSLFDKDKAKSITQALIIYLKQLFEHDNLNEMNSLTNEMELVKSFAFIQLERFPGLNIQYDIPEELPDIMIPSLTLQPLLENAINHGVRKKSSKGEGTVIISIRAIRNYVFFSIKDNGAGEDENKLKKALTVSKDGKFHTLIHISYRLKKLYNENISVKSINGVGTFISFKIPTNTSKK